MSGSEKVQVGGEAFVVELVGCSWSSVAESSLLSSSGCWWNAVFSWVMSRESMIKSFLDVCALRIMLGDADVLAQACKVEFAWYFRSLHDLARFKI